MNPATGKMIMLIGAGLFLIGILVFFLHDKMQWIGRLPGDIRIERENFRFYFPITTMILASIVLSLVLRMVRKLLE